MSINRGDVIPPLGMKLGINRLFWQFINFPLQALACHHVGLIGGPLEPHQSVIETFRKRV